jgi:CBS domain containing-hemolysin-like protein
MLATTQLGITVCSLLILNLSEPAIHHLLGYPLSALGLADPVIDVAGFAIALLVVTFLHVVLGEMVPKNLAFSVPDRAALILAPPLVLIGRLVKPIIVALNWTANCAVRAFGMQPKDEATSTYTLEEVASIVRESERAGTLTDVGGRLSAALEFTAKIVGDLVVPADQLIWLEEQATPADVQRLVAEHGYSRYPVQNSAAEPFGYIHLKDVLDLEDEVAWDTQIPRDRIRPLMTVPESAEAEDALRAMRTGSSHLALAVNEAGVVSGVIFLEDVLEELVGRIEDSTNAD